MADDTDTPPTFTREHSDALWVRRTLLLQDAARAIDAARDAIAKAQGEGLPADQMLAHAKRAALGHVAEADAAAIAARLLAGEE